MSSPYSNSSSEPSSSRHHAAAFSSSAPHHPPQHTQFLDLTNGEGGEGQPSSVYQPTSPVVTTSSSSSSGLVHHHGHTNNPTATAAAVAAAAAAEGGDDDEEFDDDDDGVDVEAMLRLSASLDPRSSDAFDANDSPGGERLVDAGHEHTGRWTKEEHDAFLAALQLYGKEWKKVAGKVQTRTVVQTRTHAQKYFQKLQKGPGGGSGEPPSTAGGSTTDILKRESMPRKKKQKRGATTATSTHKPAAASTTKTKSSSTGLHFSSKANRRSSSATMSAAQVITTLSTAPTSPYKSRTAVTALRGVDDGDDDRMQAPPPAHGFSMPTEDSSGNATTSLSFASPRRPWSASFNNNSMRIHAPDPNLQRHRFPEPSPAATGKRKLAEIAAAQMLAGVFAADDGPPTPPPTPHSLSLLRNAPPPPLVSFGATKMTNLQIVNPASLGVTHTSRRDGKQQPHGGDSPVTPWDGELEALVGASTNNYTITTTSAASNFRDDRKVSALPVAPLLSEPPQCHLHPVNGPATAYRRSALHRAVCQRDLVQVQRELELLVATSSANPAKPQQQLLELDDAGYAPLHSACAQQMINTAAPAATANETVRLLLAAQADPGQPDRNGNTPLHWAARAGDQDAVEQLVHRNAPLDARNQWGESPLHWALRRGCAAVVNVLLDSRVRVNVLDKYFRRPIDVAVEGFADEEGSLAAVQQQQQRPSSNSNSKELQRVLQRIASDRRDIRAGVLLRSAHSRTLVLHHPECLDHHPKADTDWEAPDRVRTIMKRVQGPGGGIFSYEVTVSQDFDRASLDLLSRVHSTEYLQFVNALSKDLEKKLKESGAGGDDAALLQDQVGSSPPPVVPFTPMVQRSMIKIAESRVKLGINSDTSFSAGSLRAARRAVGAVQHAVDCVLVGRNRNAFCVVRPPGHHAGISGLLEGGESCGFCIFNNVAAGALHAVSDDKLLCNKCAIVDIDVHHGNGTEEIVRRCNDPSKMFFFSIHLYDNDKKNGNNNSNSNQYSYKFYPGTGSEDDLALNIINVPIVPLWKDPSNRSQQGTQPKTHNTRNKVKAGTGGGDDEGSDSGGRLPPSDTASDAGSSTGGNNLSTSNHARLVPPSATSVVATSGRMAYRQAIQNRLLPALRAFNPDLILISAGFDAAKGDVGNARHERGRERMGLDLEPEDYAWTTRKILEIADICCQGRVVSVLEGGYGRTPTTAPDAETCNLDRSVFGECAIRHLHAMIDPYNAENRFSSA